MKKFLFCLIIMMFCSFAGQARAADIYNYALGKTPVGSFTDPASAVDDSLSTFSLSGNINEAPQFFTIDLGAPVYIGSVRVVWGANALSNDYSIRVSNDKKNWYTEFSELNAAEGVGDAANGTISQIVATTRYTIPSRYLQIYIPVGSTSTAGQVKIAEVQVLPAQDLKFSLLEIAPYAVGDTKALIVYKTSIGAVGGEILYGRSPADLNKKAVNLESGVINSVVLTDLSPGFVHYYKVRTWDASGKVVGSDVKYFTPAKANLALGKPVTGTFTNFPPNDNLVDRTKDVISRTVDGITSYFKGMATSGSLINNDQEVVIDLNGIHPLGSVVSYWRALAYPESFTVQISQDRSAWKDVASKVNAGEGAFARSDGGDPMRVVNTSLNGEQTRYVRISIGRGSPFFVKHPNWDFVQLMEVEVFPK